MKARKRGNIYETVSLCDSFVLSNDSCCLKTYPLNTGSCPFERRRYRLAESEEIFPEIDTALFIYLHSATVVVEQNERAPRSARGYSRENAEAGVFHDDDNNNVFIIHL